MSQREIIRWLMNIGFNSKEARILLLLAQKGPMTVNEIAEHVKIARPHIYSTLQDLYGKGYIEQIDERPKKYTNIDFASKIGNILKEKEKYNENMLRKIRSMSSSNVSGTVFLRNKKSFDKIFLQEIKNASIRVWLVTENFSILGNNIEKNLAKMKNRIDVRIAISDIRYLRTFSESPSFIRYIQPPPPFVFSIVDNKLFFAPLTGVNNYFGLISDDSDLVNIYAMYFDHIWKDDYVRTLYRLRMTTPKEY